MGNVRGILLTLVGLSIFSTQFIGIFFARAGNKGEAIDATRRFGPLFLLAYCLLTLLFSPGEKAFAFTPAEVGMLFPAPFSRRQLLVYKVGGNLMLTLLSAIFFSAVMRSNAPNIVSGYVGLVLALSFLQLFAIAVTLAGASIGASFSTWRRRLALGLIVAILGGIALSAGLDAVRSMTLENLKALEHAPFVRAVMAPFQPFANALTARTAGSLAIWGGIAPGDRRRSVWGDPPA